MRDYGRVAPTFWTRGSGKKLRGNPKAQIVALYLFTCPTSSMIGIYHLAVPTMAHEIGLSVEDAERALADVCALDIARYDPEEELIYLPEGARYQIGERLKPGDKRVAGIRAAVARFAKHPFAADFAQRYAAEFALGVTMPRSSSPGSDPPSARSFDDWEGASDPLPESEDDPPKGLGSQDQDQDQKQVQDQDQEQEQKSRTLHTRAHAHENRGEDDGVGRVCSLDEFRALLEGRPALAIVAADSPAVAGLHEAFLMTHKARATIGLAERAVADLIGQGVPKDRLAARTRLSRFLSSAKPSRPSEHGALAAMTPDVRRVLEVFGEVWAQRKRGVFVVSDGDDEHAATLVSLAKPHATKPNEGSAIVRHWAERYLADADPFVANQEHPLRLLPSRVSKYGLPKAKKPQVAKAPREPEPPACAPPPEFLKHVATLGNGPSGAPPPPRPGTRPSEKAA
jgi:hypothetical protein